MSVDPKRTAVVLIEFQNDFTSEGGVLHDAVNAVMEQTGMLDNTRALVEAAREAGATIVHAPITFAPGYGELSDHPYGILKGVVDSTAFVKGEWGAEIVDALAPQEGDVVVEGKRGLDTFATTNLDFILRARGITTIALGGFLTNCCVESTMRTGYEKGYEVITLSDCVAATSPEEHENAIRFDYPMFSDGDVLGGADRGAARSSSGRRAITVVYRLARKAVEGRRAAQRRPRIWDRARRPRRPSGAQSAVRLTAAGPLGEVLVRARDPGRLAWRAIARSGGSAAGVAQASEALRRSTELPGYSTLRRCRRIRGDGVRGPRDICG